MSEVNTERENVYTEHQHEREMTRVEIQAKRWFIFAMILLFLFVGTNLAWVIYENSFQDIVLEQEADSGEGGYASVYGAGIGDVNVGESKTDDPDPGETQQ